MVVLQLFQDTDMICKCLAQFPVKLGYTNSILCFSDSAGLILAELKKLRDYPNEEGRGAQMVTETTSKEAQRAA